MRTRSTTLKHSVVSDKRARPDRTNLGDMFRSMTRSAIVEYVLKRETAHDALRQRMAASSAEVKKLRVQLASLDEQIDAVTDDLESALCDVEPLRYDLNAAHTTIESLRRAVSGVGLTPSSDLIADAKDGKPFAQSRMHMICARRALLCATFAPIGEVEEMVSGFVDSYQNSLMAATNEELVCVIEREPIRDIKNLVVCANCLSKFHLSNLSRALQLSNDKMCPVCRGSVVSPNHMDVLPLYAGLDVGFSP